VIVSCRTESQTQSLYTPQCYRASLGKRLKEAGSPKARNDILEGLLRYINFSVEHVFVERIQSVLFQKVTDTVLTQKFPSFFF
jgi:hypothetical protein